MNLYAVLRDPEVDEMKRRIPGVAPALVTDNVDPEGMGRVRVRYPWLAGNTQSYWARVARPFAGSGIGDWNPLQINDEVLVAFELGQIDTPYVVGVLWNGVDTPPEIATDKHVRKTKKGYKWEIDEGQERISFLASAWQWILDLAGNTLNVILGGKTRVQSDGAFVEIDGDTIKTQAASWQDSSDTVDLAGGGQGVARIGDEVEVVITSGSSAGTYTGTIIGGSSKVTAG